MDKQNVIKIVEKAFNDCLYGTIIGAPPFDEAHIGGRPAFFRQIKKELDELLKKDKIEY